MSEVLIPTASRATFRIRPQIQNVRHQMVLDVLWWGRTDSLFCGKATPVETVHRTVSKSRLSNPPSNTKVPTPYGVGTLVAKNPNNDTTRFGCTPLCRWGAFLVCGVHFICQRCTPGRRCCTPAVITEFSVKSGLCLRGTPARPVHPEPDTDCSWCQR